MADISKAIQDLDNSISKVKSNVGDTAAELKYLEEQISSMEKIVDLNNLQKQQLKDKRDVVVDLRVKQRESSEQERAALENIIGKNKNLAETVKELSKHHRHLAGVLHHSAGAYSAFAKSADLGKTVQHLFGIGGAIPGFKSLGVVLGFIVGAATNAQDRIQAINKTIIDLSASTGKFGEGMSMANDKTVAITAGFAKYGQSVGMASKEVQDLAGNLGQVGFTMEEMGIDKQTGQIKSLSSALNSNAGEWGALSTVIGAARATGLGYGQVASQLQMQVKDLGDTVQGTGKTFAALSIAANRSRLSTGILLPVLQQVQSSFKNIGLDSAKAVEMLGKAGEAAKKAGVGAGAAVDVMGKAISGMANMDMGKMAFLGQQLGMGGGLSAGLQFRKQIGGESGGAEIAQQIGQVIGKIMGGSGELVSEEQAIGNERLAAIRIGQEQLASQMFGLSQNDAKVFINISKELSALNSAGEGDSEEAKKLNKKLEEMKMSESDYRKKTLSAQQKIQNLMELITTLVGNMVVIFVRAFAGGAAKGGSLGKGITEVLNSIKTGQGLDTLSDKISGLGESLEKTVGPVIESFGGTLGKLIGFHWTSAIGLVFGGGALLAGTVKMFSSFIASLMQKSITGMMLGAGGSVVRGVLGTTNLAKSAIESTAAVSKFGKAFSGIGLGVIGGVLGLGTAAIIAAEAIEDAALEEKERMNKMAGASNAYLVNLQKMTKPLEKITGRDENEAFQLLTKMVSGKATTVEKSEYQEKKFAIEELAKTFIEKQIEGLKREKALANPATIQKTTSDLEAMENWQKTLEIMRSRNQSTALNENARVKETARVTEAKNQKPQEVAFTFEHNHSYDPTTGKWTTDTQTKQYIREAVDKNNNTPANARENNSVQV